MEDMDWGWSRELSTGIISLDVEHRRLIWCYRELVRHVRDTVDMARFRESFQSMKEHMRSHFAHEEQVMRNIGYPHFHRHKTAHDKVLADFGDFSLNIGTVFTENDLYALAKHFKYWLRHHVQEYDVA